MNDRKKIIIEFIRDHGSADFKTSDFEEWATNKGFGTGEDKSTSTWREALYRHSNADASKAKGEQLLVSEKDDIKEYTFKVKSDLITSEESWVDFIEEQILDGDNIWLQKEDILNSVDENRLLPGDLQKSGSRNEHRYKQQIGNIISHRNKRFIFKKEDGRIYFSSANIMNESGKAIVKGELVLGNSRKGRKTQGAGKVTVTREKDLSQTHTKMLDTIEKYAKKNNIEYDIERENIDALLLDGDVHNLYEVKSYKDGIYEAVGQLIFYEHTLKSRYGNVEDIKKHIVGNFELSDKWLSFLNSIDITYLHIDHFL